MFCGSAMSYATKRSKRQLSDDESESSQQIPTIQKTVFPKFIIIEALNKDKPITSLSPFVIEKTISSIIGTPTSIKNLRNGSLLVEVNKKQQAENLLKTSLFFDNEVNVYAHPTLNSSRGVVRCREISDIPLDELKKEMKKEGVTDVKRISIKRNGKEIQTNTYVFTFNTPVLPTKVKIAYHLVSVDIYIPNPLQCFRCQRFGHHEDSCKAQEAVCGRCAKTGHNFRDCEDAEITCANCHQNHQANSRSCNFWKKEKEILKIKYTENISFYDARLTFENRNRIVEITTSNTSYASVSKPKTECEQCKTLVDKLCLLFPEKAEEIRNLVQSPKDVPAVASNPVTTKALTDTGNSNSQTKKQQPKQPEQKQLKAKETPREKLSLPAKSINKSTPSSETKKSSDKKKKITRIVAVGDEVITQPIPTSSNRYQALSDMEDDSGEEAPSEEPPSTPDI